MSHGLFTLFQRSMRADLRGWKGHGFRIAFALFIYFSLAIAQVSSLAFGAPGLRFFSSICYLNLFFIILAGCSFFATAITEEKEEDTLGLLRMAGMNQGAILLGKSTSRLCASLLLLVIQLPFLLLAITLGGVLYHQIAAAAVTLISFLIFTANVGLFFSVICRRSGHAVAYTGMLLVGRLFLPMLWTSASSSIQWFPSLQTLVDMLDIWLPQTSPWSRLAAIMSTGFAEPLISPQVQFDLLGGLLFFALSWILFEPFTQGGRVETATRGPLQHRRKRFGFFAVGRAWENPYLWHSYNFFAGGTSMLLIKFLAYLAIGVLFAIVDYWNVFDGGSLRAYQLNWNDVGGAFAFIVIAGMFLELTIAASRIFHDEWQWKTLESLLLLPESIHKIGWSKVAGVLIGLIPGLFCLALALLISEDAQEVVQDALLLPGGWATIMAAVLFLHLVALVSLFVKWGSIPLSILLSVVVSYAMTPFFLFAFFVSETFNSEQFGLLLVVGVQIGLCIIMQLLIAKRLEVLGGQ